MSSESIDQIKSGLRRQFRKARQGITQDERLQYDQAIGDHITALVVQQGAARIAGYLAFDGEPDITTTLARANTGMAQVNLPVITASVTQASMIFRRWLPHDEAALKKNNFGIDEPVIGPQAGAADLDIIFMPLVAWDSMGGRLGMGAGYYDRALTDVANLSQPLRIGVAYEAQKADSIPMTENDVRLHGVITEKGLVTFNE